MHKAERSGRSIKHVQCRALVHRDVIGFCTLYLILRVGLATSAHQAFEISVLGVHLNNRATGVAELDMPAHQITYSKFMLHQISLWVSWRSI